MSGNVKGMFGQLGSRNTSLSLNAQVKRNLESLTLEERKEMWRVFGMCADCILEEPEYGSPEWVKWDNAPCTHKQGATS